MKKILIFILCFCSLFLCFVIPSFADAEEGVLMNGEVYTFAEELSPDFLLPTENPYSLRFISNDTYFESITVRYTGFVAIYYDDVLVHSSAGWINDSYRTIISEGSNYLDPALRSFLLVNEAETFSLFDTFYDLVKNAVFGSRTLTDFETLVLNLLAIVFSFCCVALPLIVIFILIKFFLGTIARY